MVGLEAHVFRSHFPPTRMIKLEICAVWSLRSSNTICFLFFIVCCNSLNLYDELQLRAAFHCIIVDANTGLELMDTSPETVKSVG